ncbi:MAG: response regulator [Victivallales bacterium]|nr:response regulator [Victivallales bacterium]
MNKQKILVVDDNEAFAGCIKDIVEAKGYESATASGGSEALEKVKNGFSGIVIMDIKMPVLNGVETLKKMKKVKPDICVILMTGFSVEDLIKDALEEGAFGILYKPLDFNKLIGMIEMVKNGGIIMITDNQPQIHLTLKNTFEKKGYSVFLAESSEKAIEIAKEKIKSIIILDMKLPPLNGLETYLEIKKLNPQTILILLIESQETKNKADSILNKNAYFCLHKPFDPEEALRIVEEIVEKKQKQN